MVILKYHEWVKFFPDLRDTVYELCSDDFKKIKQLSKEEACQMIKDNNLQRVYRDLHGAIWK